MDLIYALLCSIRLYFATYWKSLVTFYPTVEIDMDVPVKLPVLSQTVLEFLEHAHFVMDDERRTATD